MKRRTPERRMPPRGIAVSHRGAIASSAATGGSSPTVPLQLDGGLVVPATLLAGFGIVMVYSASAAQSLDEALPPQFARHVLAIALAVGCAAGASRVPLAVWNRIAFPLWIACGLGLLATLAFGVEVNGARRWLAIPGLSIHLQAGELAKWTTVLAVAAYLSRERDSRSAPDPARPLRVATLFTLPVVALLLLQPDFGSAALVTALVGLLLFTSGVPVRQLAVPAAIACLGSAVYASCRPYALARWKTFLDPWQEPLGDGFQLVQSFVAFARGGALGLGLGDGRQKLFYLPEAHTDFILAIVAEEVGLVGVLAVLGAFAALMVAGFRVARRARDPFALLLAFGMTALIGVPAAINAGVVMGLLPTTGMTLPFVSVGANSLITCALALGILVRIAGCEAAPERERVAGASTRGRGNR